MEIINLTVESQSIVSDRQYLVSDSRNVYECHFEFDEKWDGFTKTAVFRNGRFYQEVLLVNDKCILPHESIDDKGSLIIGVYGIGEDQTYPTVFSSPLLIKDGAYLGVHPEPTPDIFQQIISLLNTLLITKQDKLPEYIRGKYLKVIENDDGELILAWEDAEGGSGVAYWSDLLGKPFETLGSVFNVVGGVLGIDLSGYATETFVNNKLNENVNVKSNNASFTVNGDTVTFNQYYKNLSTGNTDSKSENLPLADDDSAGFMSPSDYQAIRENASRIEALEGQTKRLLYTESENPTQAEIAQFVTDSGYTENLESIAVVVSGTFHIWHYYTQDGWKDDGVDTVNQFTNQSAGLIKGSNEDGQVFAETNGTGSVKGWSTLKNTVQSLVSAIANKISGIKLAGTLQTPDSDGNVDIPVGTSSDVGLLRGYANGGIEIDGRAAYKGAIKLKAASESAISSRAGTGTSFSAIATNTYDLAVKHALCDEVGTPNPAYTDTEKAAARDRLGVINGLPILTGTTFPSNSTVGMLGQLYLDTNKSNIYICTKILNNVYTWKLVTIFNSPNPANVSIGEGSSVSNNYKVAIGNGAQTSNNGDVAIGQLAKASAANNMQFGWGTNTTPYTIAFGYGGIANYILFNMQTGLVPKERLNLIKTSMDSVATVQTEYYLGEQSSVSITLPTGNAGEKISVVFYSGTTPTVLSVTNDCLGEVPTPKANERIELSFLFDGTNWCLLSNVMAVPQEVVNE